MIPITLKSLFVFSLAVGGLTALLVWLFGCVGYGLGYGLGYRLENTDLKRDVRVPDDAVTQKIRARVAARLTEDEDERATREWPAVLRGGAAKDVFDRRKAEKAIGRSERL